MDITTRSTMIKDETITTYLFRGEEEIRRALRDITMPRPSVLYQKSCGFINASTADEYANQMLADQELYKKQSGLRIRVNDITVHKNELHYGREFQELKQIADSMAAYYAAEGFPTVYDVWMLNENTYKITYAISVVSPVDGRKYTWNDKEKYEREKCALDTIAYRVIGKTKPKDEFNFVIQENH